MGKAAKSRPVVYLISAAEDIAPAAQALSGQGRRITSTVQSDARITLKSRGRFIVIAHGSPNGTVKWHSASGATDWLWVGMPPLRRKVRLYLYCCHVGRLLPAHLANCEVFGHMDVVPIPQNADDKLILDFIKKIHKL